MRDYVSKCPAASSQNEDTFIQQNTVPLFTMNMERFPKLSVKQNKATT